MSRNISTKQLVTVALFCAISILLSFIEFPIFPAAAFLKYDASIVPCAVIAFAYGSPSGVVAGIICAVVHGLMMGDLSGAIMNILVVLAFVLPLGPIYRRFHTFKGAVAGLLCASVMAVCAAILGNLVVTPLYLGTPIDAVIAMIIPILLPFNLIKAVLNSVFTLLIYKSISNLITPKKLQVHGFVASKASEAGEDLPPDEAKTTSSAKNAEPKA